MSSLTLGLLILACIFGGALLGLLLRAFLPEHHLNSETKDVVKLSTGLIGTMAALVLGLLVSAAKSSYDLKKGEVTEMSANMVMLDRILAHYGPEAKDLRASLHRAAEGAIERIWSDSAPRSGQGPLSTEGEALYDKIRQLGPANDAQRALQAEAQGVYGNLARTRLLLLQQAGSSISIPLLIVLVFWLTIIFVSFGLFAPRNATVVAALFMGALSVSGAIFLILELDRPFDGLIQISSAPLQNALTLLGK